MVTETALQGKVAQVLSERELVINIGTRDGVRKGMRFAVLAETGLEIRDPDTGDILGHVDREKVRVDASDVQERLTICSTYGTRTVGGGLLSLFSGLPTALEPRHEVPVTLRASDRAYPPPLAPEESFVKIGDRVKQVSD